MTHVISQLFNMVFINFKRFIWLLTLRSTVKRNSAELSSCFEVLGKYIKTYMRYTYVPARLSLTFDFGSLRSAIQNWPSLKCVKFALYLFLCLWNCVLLFNCGGPWNRSHASLTGLFCSHWAVAKWHKHVWNWRCLAVEMSFRSVSLTQIGPLKTHTPIQISTTFQPARLSATIWLYRRSYIGLIAGEVGHLVEIARGVPS